MYLPRRLWQKQEVFLQCIYMENKQKNLNTLENTNPFSLFIIYLMMTYKQIMSKITEVQCRTNLFLPTAETDGISMISLSANGILFFLELRN